MAPAAEDEDYTLSSAEITFDLPRGDNKNPRATAAGTADVSGGGAG